MSNIALNLLIESELITASGKVIDLSRCSSSEISRRISNYMSKRIETVASDVAQSCDSKWLNALFSSSSTNITKNKLLSSALVYQSIIIDDPLYFFSDSIDFQSIEKGLELYSWAFEMIRHGYIKTMPMSYLNNPSKEIKILRSDDAFKSSIPKEIHDFVHENAILQSVIKNDEEQFLILNESADVSRRVALHVSFKDDYWHSGVGLYLFQKYENNKITWNKDEILGKESFEAWAYQTINQAMRARLIDICNESKLASSTGHTYITESSFESTFMAMSGSSNHSLEALPARFLQANESFIAIDSPKTILELRNKHSIAFERFNFTLQSISEELSNVDSSDFERKASSLFYKEVSPQIDEIRDNANSIISSGIKGVLLSMTGFSMAIATGSSLPIISSLLCTASNGLTELLPAVSQQQSLKSRPAYIWHKITK